ncbi:MAG: Abi family protein [Lachnospiraceae bacterium]|nr:Abi family protein [Lachnospiraceae bacterium]
MNRTDKPKMTSKALVGKLRDEKGVSFNYVTEDNAEKYLAQTNNYLRTAAYRKNYQKYLNGPSKGKYIDLDFAYLQELSTVDMHLRNLVTKMCIDIEHDLKVLLLENLENDVSEDGYSIVDNFLGNNPYIVGKIEATSASPFTGNLISKYFTVRRVYNAQNGKTENKITAFDCPAWVLVELLSFGDFIRFYEYYYGLKGGMPVDIPMINLVKSLRNGCAHNNCIIADLNSGSSVAPAAIYRIVKTMPDINKNQRQKKLACRAILEFVSMLCVYDVIVSEKVKKNRIKELKQLFDVRIKEKKGFFKKNQLITSTFDFVYKVIKNLFG